MASENLTLELWELIQKNNKEEISYNDFENDLNKAFNLPKDEVDRALAIMISQAEVNPDMIGEYKGGSFMISQSFAANITNTIKYENQFIPGKEEFTIRQNSNKMMDDLGTLVILPFTPEVFDKMISDYEKLSDEEQNILWDSYGDMSQKQRSELDKAHDEALKEKQESKDTPPEESKKIESIRASNKIEDSVIKAAECGDEGSIQLLREYFNNMKMNDPEQYSGFFDGDDIDFLALDAASIIKLAKDHRGQKQSAQNQNIIKGRPNPKVTRFKLCRNGKNSILINRGNKIESEFSKYDFFENNDKSSFMMPHRKVYEQLLSDGVMQGYSQTLTGALDGVENTDGAIEFLDRFIKKLTPEVFGEIDGADGFYDKLVTELDNEKDMLQTDRSLLAQNIRNAAAGIYSALSTMGAKGYVDNILFRAKLKYNAGRKEDDIVRDAIENEGEQYNDGAFIPEEPIRREFDKSGVQLNFDETEMARLNALLAKMGKSKRDIIEPVVISQETHAEKTENETIGASVPENITESAEEVLESDDVTVTTGDDLFAGMDDMLGMIEQEGQEQNQYSEFLEANKDLKNIDIKDKKSYESYIKPRYEATMTKDGGIGFFNPKAFMRAKRRLRPVRMAQLKKTQDEFREQVEQQKNNEENNRSNEEPVQE